MITPQAWSRRSHDQASSENLWFQSSRDESTRRATGTFGSVDSQLALRTRRNRMRAPALSLVPIHWQVDLETKSSARRYCRIAWSCTIITHTRQLQQFLAPSSTNSFLSIPSKLLRPIELKMGVYHWTIRMAVLSRPSLVEKEDFLGKWIGKVQGDCSGWKSGHHFDDPVYELVV